DEFRFPVFRNAVEVVNCGFGSCSHEVVQYTTKILAPTRYDLPSLAAILWQNSMKELKLYRTRH
ncbi:MAG: hypothetical protein M3447_11870, partial [Acidobacteriota bacterium]|nr:hypothetical protein [Acidobacteriota bacterium]